MKFCFRVDSTAPQPDANLAQEVIDSFQYLDAYGVLVCKPHRYAVRNLKKHLDNEHSYPSTVKKTVVAHFAEFRLVPPEEAPLPTPNGSPIPCLRDPVPGFHCAGDEEGCCGFLTARRDKIARHCNQAHRWSSSIHDRQHWREVSVQTFCTSSGKQRYFIVQTEDEHSSEVVPDQLKSEVDDILRGFVQMKSQRQKDLEVLSEEMANTDQTGWWKKTGWVEHLKGSNLRQLAHASRLPDKNDAPLRRVGGLMGTLIKHCVNGLMTLPMGLRRWLKSVQIAEVDPRPMGRLQHESSQDRYAIYWTRLICYCLRVLQSESGYDERDHHDMSHAVDVDVSEGDNGHATAKTPDDMPTPAGCSRGEKDRRHWRDDFGTRSCPVS